MQIESMTRQGKKFVLLPEKAFQRLMQDVDMLADIRAYDVAKARLERGEDELIPFDIITRRLAGEHPLKLWREHRGLTQEALAAASGLSRGMIAAMEAGHKQGSVASLKKLARALGCDLENLA